jgi:hypothetical protein
METALRICTDQKEWDALADSVAHSTFFHRWEFLKTMEKHSGYKLHPLIGASGNASAGLYPLFYKKRSLLKTVFSPPPQCAVPYLGPLIVDYETLKQSKKESRFIDLQNAADEYMRTELKADYVSVTTCPGLQDARPLKWSAYSVEPLYYYHLDLSMGLEYVFDQLKKNLRQNIGKERKKGVEITEGTRDDLETVYDLLFERYRQQEKIVTVPKKYLLELYDRYHPGNMKVIVSKYRNETLGGIVDIYNKDRVISWIGNPKPVDDVCGSSDLLQWGAIEMACKSGAKSYEEIGASTERLCRYKSKYNPELKVYFTGKKHLSGMSKAAEYGYAKVLKPLTARIRRK